MLLPPILRPRSVPDRQRFRAPPRAESGCGGLSTSKPLGTLTPSRGRFQLLTRRRHDIIRRSMLRRPESIASSLAHPLHLMLSKFHSRSRRLSPQPLPRPHGSSGLAIGHPSHVRPLRRTLAHTIGKTPVKPMTSMFLTGMLTCNSSK